MFAKQYNLRAGHWVWIFVIALVAALAVFADAPEAVFVQSEDGFAALRGYAPRTFGSISINRATEGAWLAPTNGVGAVYVIEPAYTLLPRPLELSIRVQDINEAANLTLAWWNADRGAWEPVPSEFDGRTQTLRANISILSPWVVLQQQLRLPRPSGGEWRGV